MKGTAQVHAHAQLYMCIYTHTVHMCLARTKTTHPLLMHYTARCKQVEHRSEDAGEGSTAKAGKQTRVRKGGGLWEEGEEERKNSILTTCTINNRGSAVVSRELLKMKRVFWFSTCSCRSLHNPNLNRPPTYSKAPPFSPPYSCSLPCSQTHIHSLTHCFLAHFPPTGCRAQSSV